MTFACVCLPDGSRLWVECGDTPVNPLDRLQIRVGEAERVATVLVSPAQLVGGTPPQGGVLIRVLPPESNKDADSLPGADLPVLGSHYESGGKTGMVTGIDPLTGSITLTMSDGEQVIVPSVPNPADVAP